MSAASAIDLNCDVGELPGPQGRSADRALIGLVTSVNIACGGHAGDAATMEATVRTAMECGAVIGAHPSYADRANFGRRARAQDVGAACAAIRTQLDALRAIAHRLGARVAHVKPHGALYNDAAEDPVLAHAIARAVKAEDTSLVLVGLAGGELVKAGVAEGLRVAAEGFCDRAYEPDGRLRSRSLAGAVISDPHDAARQAVTLALRGDLQTLCIHGDEPTAVDVAKAVREALARARVTIACGWTGASRR